MTPVAMGNFPTDFCRCSLVALYFTITDMIFRRMAVEIFCLIFKVSRMVFFYNFHFSTIHIQFSVELFSAALLSTVCI